MRKIGGIHTFEDQAFLRSASRMSAGVLVLGVLAGAAWFAGVSALAAHTGTRLFPFELQAVLGGVGARIMGAREGLDAAPDIVWWLSFAAAVAASLLLHELVHAFFFKQFAPPGAAVALGANWRLGMLYASAEGIVYTRQQYLIIAVAPSVAVTLLLVAVGIGLKWPLWTIVAVTVHLAGCTGDWGYIRAIRRDASITHCEDTSWGVAFYGDDAAAPAAGLAAQEGFSVVDGGKSA